MPTSRYLSVRLWSWCVLALAGLAALQIATAAKFTAQPWETKDGLPSSVIIAMAQTPDHYLWLGTYRGLARFDGRRFEVFNEFNTPELGSSLITFLFADRRGNLWVGTETAGAVLIKDGQVARLEIGNPSREGRLVAACEQTNGVVWLVTANGQLGRYEPGHLSVWQLKTNAPVTGEYRSMAVEEGGGLWIGAQRRLCLFDPTKITPGKNLPTETEFGVANLDALLTSSRGGFWVLANGRVQKYRANRIERDLGSYPWADAPVLSTCEDAQGNLVVGTQNRGVTWFDASGRADMLTSSDTLTHNTVLSLHADDEGSLWVGTDNGGLNRVRRQVFEVLPDSNGKTVQSVHQDGEGGIWFGLNGDAVNNVALLHMNDGVVRKFGAVEGLAYPAVRAVLADRQKKVWIGTYGGGLFQLENESIRSTASPGLVISCLFEDRQGVLWAGTPGGLSRYVENRWQSVTNRDGLAAGDVRAIADDADGNLWIGTERGGLKRWRDGNLTHYGQAGVSISALLADSDGTLWIGTPGNGLMRHKDGQWTRITTDEGLADNSVAYLLDDADGFLWIGSNAGLLRVPRAELNELAARKRETVSCRAYSTSDGLPTSECTSGSQPAAWRSRDGKLWFATTKGLVSVLPTQLTRNTNPPPVVIESVLVDDKLQNTNRLRMSLPSPLRIPPGKEQLEIRYTSLNLLAPDRTRFRYQLEGFQSEATDVGAERVVRYPKLPPDEYLFRVTACNEDGVWNETGVTLAIVVEPPFWQTWWFRSLVVVGLVGAIVGVVYFISTQKLQRQLARLKQQEAVEKERARIARDLHDQLGANLTQVSLLGEMVETDKDLPEEVEAHAKQISQTARLTSAALDEIVWAANPSNDTLEGLVTYACKYAQEYLAVANLSYRLDAPDKLPPTPIPPEVRHNVFLAFKESINNVVKHAQARTVKVRIRLNSNQFTFEIEDDGRGLPPDARDKGRNGLRNMRKRMEDVGGGFAADPAPEHGTIVRLTAPLGSEVRPES